MNKFQFIAVKYKYDECPICFPRDPDAGIAFIEDLNDPREMKVLTTINQLTNIYSSSGIFKGAMYTHKANHHVAFVMFCEKIWQPSKFDGTFFVYHKEIYECSNREIANFMISEDPLIRDYATRVYKIREQIEVTSQQ